MNVKTVGTVVEVKKQWWLKVNTKPIRSNTFDGATFPHIIKVRYTVGGNEYFKRKWVRACENVPSVDSEITVFYDENKPKRSKIILKQTIKQEIF